MNNSFLCRKSARRLDFDSFHSFHFPDLITGTTTGHGSVGRNVLHQQAAERVTRADTPSYPHQKRVRYDAGLKEMGGGVPDNSQDSQIPNDVQEIR